MVNIPGHIVFVRTIIGCLRISWFMKSICILCHKEAITLSKFRCKTHRLQVNKNRLYANVVHDLVVGGRVAQFALNCKYVYLFILSHVYLCSYYHMFIMVHIITCLSLLYTIVILILSCKHVCTLIPRDEVESIQSYRHKQSDTRPSKIICT